MRKNLLDLERFREKLEWEEIEEVYERFYRVLE